MTDSRPLTEVTPERCREPWARAQRIQVAVEHMRQAREAFRAKRWELQESGAAREPVGHGRRAPCACFGRMWTEARPRTPTPCRGRFGNPHHRAGPCVPNAITGLRGQSSAAPGTVLQESVRPWLSTLIRSSL